LPTARWFFHCLFINPAKEAVPITTDVIRSGRVSSINYEAGKIRVVYDDKNSAVTQELPMQSFEYDMPKIGDMVYVAHQSNSVEFGVVLGGYFNQNNVPRESGPNRQGINPDALINLFIQAGAKRVEIRSPVFTVINDTSVANENLVNLIYGGLEDD